MVEVTSSNLVVPTILQSHSADRSQGFGKIFSGIFNEICSDLPGEGWGGRISRVLSLGLRESASTFAPRAAGMVLIGERQHFSY